MPTPPGSAELPARAADGVTPRPVDGTRVASTHAEDPRDGRPSPGIGGGGEQFQQGRRGRTTMKFRHLASIAMSCLVLALGSGTASAGIATTKHNLGSTGTGTNTIDTTGDICVFCHTPHGADASNPSSNPPLWNRIILQKLRRGKQPRIKSLPAPSRSNWS